MRTPEPAHYTTDRRHERTDHSMQKQHTLHRCGVLSVRNDIKPVSKNGSRDLNLHLRLDLSTILLIEINGKALFQSARFGVRLDSRPDELIPAWQVIDKERIHDPTYMIDIGVIEVKGLNYDDKSLTKEEVTNELTKSRLVDDLYCSLAEMTQGRNKFEIFINWGNSHPEYMDITIEHEKSLFIIPGKLIDRIAQILRYHLRIFQMPLRGFGF